MVQFYSWKASELQKSEHDEKINVLPLTQSQREECNRLKRAFLKDEQLAETLFGSMAVDRCKQNPFNWASFSAAVTAWEAYCDKLGKEMLISLTHWQTQQSIFSVPSSDIEEEIET